MKLLLHILTLIFLVFIGILCSQSYYKVTNVIDGDTYVLDNDIRIRLIGIDTPEKLHPLKPLQFYSQEATDFAKQLVEGGKVRLEYDDEKIDKYGRTLAYVYLSDSTFVNKEMILQGYAYAYTKYPFKYLKEFVEAENEARKLGIGLWKDKGRAELIWIKEQNRVPFSVYEMTNSSWGIEYGKYCKLRIKSEELQWNLDSLRLWVNEFSERDLQEILINNGWLIFQQECK